MKDINDIAAIRQKWVIRPDKKRILARIFGKDNPPQFMDLTLDWSFKYVFASEGCKPLLLKLLNLLIEDREISEITHLNPEHVYHPSSRSKSVFDIYCLCSDGSRIIVEMQNDANHLFLKRAFAYSALAVMDQAEPDWDYDYDKIYCIAIINDIVFPYSTSPITSRALQPTGVTDKEDKRVDGNYLQIIVELPKFANRVEDASPGIERLMVILRDVWSWKECPEGLGEDDIYAEMMKKTMVRELTEEDRIKYLNYCRPEYEVRAEMKASLEEATELAKEEGHAEGLAKGIAEGRAKGIAEGRAKGIAEGRAEGIAEIAHAMKKEGLSDEMITKLTGLAADQLKNI